MLERNFEVSAEERTRRNTVVKALLADLDRHCPGEADHARRVAVYALATAEKLGFTDEEMMTLRYAADLHDIGKLRVDPTLLLADRPLEPDERALVETHVLEIDTLLPNEYFLQPTLGAILHHHERWNGEGYPHRLSGEAIPISARILGVAEAIDVMLQGAVWRPAFPEEAALAAMRGLAGTWFDPAVVEALLDVQPLIQPVAT